jgi:Protein of unknown function (DUF1524)
MDVTSPTLEHILPKSLGPEWDETMQADTALKEDCLYRLGNMCLLMPADNRGLGRKSFEQKRKVYQQSGIRITSRVAEYPVWDRTSIEKRQMHMAELAVSAWRF